MHAANLSLYGVPLQRRYTYWLLGAGKEHIRLVHYGLREWPNREQVQGQQDQVPPVPQVPHEVRHLALGVGPAVCLSVCPHTQAARIAHLA